MDGKFIAYYRVSTDRQGMNGNGMTAQRKAVERSKLYARLAGNGECMTRAAV
jgi:DNA invertase Pin-like site-specific DNA recombinase